MVDGAAARCWPPALELMEERKLRTASCGSIVALEPLAVLLSELVSS